MSSRSYYNQKKKKEALRRLSQSGARGVKSPRDAAPDDPLRQERGTRRHQRHSMEEDDHHSAGGIFGGRRVIATDSPLSGTHLVIQANVGGQSSGADTPDTEPDQPRRVVTSQPTSVPQGPFKLFGKSAGVSSSPPSDKTWPGGGVSSGIFNSPQKSAEESEAPGSEKQYQASPTRRSVFQAETSNFFPIRPLSGNASADDLQTSHKGTNSAGSLSAQDSTANPFAKCPQEVSLHSSVTEVPESLFRSKEASPGVDSVTRNLFGKPAPKSTESSSLLFGKSAPKPEILFGKEVSRELEAKPQGKVLFGKVIELSSRRDHGDVPAKRQLSPSRSEAASKRTLMAFNDPFSSTSSDITDLETFGADTSKKDARQKKPLIKRSGLFGKAIAEASGRSHDSPRGDQPSDSHALTSKTHKSRSRSPEKRKQSPGRSSEDEIKKTRDESKPGRRSSSSSSSSRRFASPEEIKKLQAIVIKGVPPVANSRAYLKDFFSQYGPVTRVFTNAAKHSAIVYFADHDSAAYAKKKARVLKRGTKPVAIFWRQGDPGPKSENRPSQDDHKVSSTKHTESKQIGVRPSLAMFNRKIEAKVNPEDGSSIVKQISSTTSAAGHQKTTNLSVPGHLLSKQVGHTAQDRYDILEDRDRVIRQGLKKKTNLAMPGAIKGTCPDMCPEKERYMREVQRRLHPYEVLQGSTDQVHVNHDAAVKEYSRSSADQEEPLPHEMRPAPVLTMTMNYLMRHVMNTGQDGHWEEWFDFLWSRTRGIRKDITQQDLRDLTAIDLMEKCARFHIFCSHRLCEEDLSTIDPKINNENLTKCMQSLKQFYRDLASEGVVCPNEAEFRAYDVLLNLNDRDILRQVQQYQKEVRSSDAVKFALKAFSAVSSNNYVKFFKLVRSATYLSACIMHRYFMQVRNMALDVMNKAYTISQTRGSRFPLANITNTLAFDDQSQALEFCLSHNLTVEDEMVQFNRAAFQQPDITHSVGRSHRIIETKNAMPIGEVVNGGPLPPDIIHKTSSSFDENGHYKGFTVVTMEGATPEDKELTASEQAASTIKPVDGTAVVVQSHVPSAFPQSATKPPHSNMEVKEVARSMFLEVIDELVKDLSENFLGWIHLIQVGSLEILQDAIERAVSPMIREIANEVIEQEQDRLRLAEMAEQKAREERKRQAMLERRERMERTAKDIVEETVNTVVDEESRVIGTTEMRAVQKELKKECIERCTSEVQHDLIDTTLLSECQQVAAEVIQSETQLRDQRLAESERAVLMGQTARYLQRWYKAYTKRIHLKHTLLSFPAAPPNQTATEQLKVLWAGRGDVSKVTEGHRQGDVTLDSPFGIVVGREHIARSILRIHYLKNLRQQQAWSPLDLPSMLCSSFHSHHAPGPAGGVPSNRQQHHYWKLVVSLPSPGSHDKGVLCDWLKAKLQRGKISQEIRKKHLGDNGQVETLSLYSSKVAHTSPSQPCTLSICTKVTLGSLESTGQRQTRHQLLGTSGILFALDPTSRNQNCWEGAKSRLECLLQAKPASPPPPLVICLFDCPATEHTQSVCKERLGLRGLSQMGLVSSYHFLVVTSKVEDPVNSKELGESVEWLASHCLPPPQLSEDSLKGYLDTGITEFFNLPLYEDARTRRDACLPEQGCHRVIDLYNAVVRHLANAASSGTLTSLSWPPAEFTKTDGQTELPHPDWNAKDTIQLLRNRIRSLTLPALPLIHEDDEWQRACDLCQEYLASIPGSHKSKAPLFARVQRILEKCRRTFEDTCYLAFDAPGCEPVAGHVPWTRVIQECIDYVMSTVHTHDQAEGNEGKQTTVYYIQHEFNSFPTPKAWKEALQTTIHDSFLQPPRFVSGVAATVQQKRAEFMDRQLEAKMAEMKENRTPRGNVSAREPPYVVDVKDTAQAVKTVLSSAKEESKKFDDLLHQWLHGAKGTTSHGGMKETDHSLQKATSPRLEQSLQDLALAMESERRADRLTELRLTSLLSL